MIKSILFLLLLLTFPLQSITQNATNLAEAKKKAILSQISTTIKEHYVFPKKTERITKELQLKFQEGAYDTLKNYENFVKVLSSELRRISGDAHFSLFYNPNGNFSKKELKNSTKNRERFYNYGVSQLSILDGNIGYLKLDFFASKNRRAYRSGFAFLSNTNGIVIDLRDNNGGDREMVGLLASYFLKKRTLLSTVEFPNGKTEKIFTSRFVSKGRKPQVPMAILVSNNSFSAAEFLSYTLKQLNRATIIGDTTYGGAHPTERHSISDSLFLFVPVARVVNPITQTNWEQVGVIPDVISSYEKSITDGHLWILKELQDSTYLESEKEFYRQEIEKLH